jgi:hypothetical protein
MPPSRNVPLSVFVGRGGLTRAEAFVRRHRVQGRGHGARRGGVAVRSYGRRNRGRTKSLFRSTQ